MRGYPGRPMERPGSRPDTAARLGDAQSSNPPDDLEYIEADADPLDTDVEDADLFLGDDDEFLGEDDDLLGD